MTAAEPNFIVYALKNSSPQHFGRIALVAALGPKPEDRVVGDRLFYAESYVLVERPNHYLIREAVVAKPQTLNEVGISVDRNFMLNAAYEHCNVLVSGIVEAKFQETKNWGIFAAPFSFAPVENTYLAMLRGMGVWRDELDLIQAKTECYELQRFLSFAALLNVTIEKPKED